MQLTRLLWTFAQHFGWHVLAAMGFGQSLLSVPLPVLTAHVHSEAECQECSEATERC